MKRIIDFFRRLFRLPPTSDVGIYLNLKVETFDVNGKRLSRQKVKNKVTTSGRNIVRDLLGRGIPGSGTGFAPTHLALGTGTATVFDSDVKLGTEVFRNILTSRKAFSSRVDLQLFLLTSEANGNTLSEAALFDSPVTDGGNMLARAKFATVIVKTSSVQVVFTWTITIASS